MVTPLAAAAVTLAACGGSNKQTTEVPVAQAQQPQRVNEDLVAHLQPYGQESELGGESESDATVMPPGPELPPMAEAPREPTIIRIDFDKLMASPVVQRYQAQLLSPLEAPIGLLGRCGLRLDQAVDSVTLYSDVFPGRTGRAETLVVQGLEKDTFERCMPVFERAAEGSAQPMTVSFEDDVAEVAMGARNMRMVWLDDDSVIAGNEVTELELNRRGELLGMANQAGDLPEILAQVDQSAALWFASAGGPMGVSGSVDLSKGVAINLGFHLADAEQAEMAAVQLHQHIALTAQEVPVLRSTLEKMEITLEGTDVHLKLALTEPEVYALVANVSADPQLREMWLLMQQEAQQI